MTIPHRSRASRFPTLLMLAIFWIAGCGHEEEIPTPLPSSTPTITASATPTASCTPTPTTTRLSETTPIRHTPTPPVYAISGRVLIDNGDPEGKGQADVTVSLHRNPDCSHYKSNDEQFLLSVQTQSDGSYAFEGREQGCYLVTVNPGETGCTPSNSALNVALDDRSADDADFYAEPKRGRIDGAVWLDTDQDGQKDSGEQGDARFRLVLWVDANCDEIAEKVRTQPLKANIQADGTYVFDGLPVEPCYVLELEKTEETVLTTGEAVAHVDLQSEPHQEVNFGYFLPHAAATPHPRLTDPSEVSWGLFQSSECYDSQRFIGIEQVPGCALLKLQGIAKPPQGARFEKYELHYAGVECSTTLESCFYHIHTGYEPANSVLFEWPVDDFPQGQTVLIRLRVVASGAYDDGCKAWVTIP